jgi:hypothetical protein
MLYVVIEGMVIWTSSKLATGYVMCKCLNDGRCECLERAAAGSHMMNRGRLYYCEQDYTKLRHVRLDYHRN